MGVAFDNSVYSISKTLTMRGRGVLIALAFLACANAEPSVPNTGQYQNNFNNLEAEANARDAQNFAEIDSYGAPGGPVIGSGPIASDTVFSDPGTKGTLDVNANLYQVPGDTWTTYPNNDPNLQITTSEDWVVYPGTYQGGTYPSAPKNNNLGLSNIFYNGLVFFLVILASGQIYQLAKNLWATKLLLWDKWFPSGARSLAPATMDLIMNSIDEAALNFADWIQQQ